MYAKIAGITHHGEGVARIDGKAVFVPYCIPGEEAAIEIIEEKKSYARGRLIQILKEDISRIEPYCPHYYECGGCAYQHVEYSRELQLKQQVVKDSLIRIGKIDAAVNPVLGMENPWRYRNKVTWHISKGRLGYYQSSSHKLLPVKTCKLIPEKMEEVSSRIQTMFDIAQYQGNGEIIIRWSKYQDKVMVVLEDFSPELPVEMIINNLGTAADSIYFYNNKELSHICGEDFLYEKVLNKEFKLSPLSFFQVNNIQNEQLIKLVIEYLGLTGDEVLLDAYCGAGNISLCAADYAAKVVGIESNHYAIEDARENAARNNLNNYEFLCAPCETVLPQLDYKFATVIVDPPRSGLKQEVITAITKSSPQRIIYVSCNPSTLARDLAVFQEHGYKAITIQPIDMFPRTGHVECVVLMTNVKNK